MPAAGGAGPFGSRDLAPSRGAPLTCEGATKALADARRDVTKAKRALRRARTEGAEERARRQLRRAKRRLRTAREAKERICANRGLVRFAVIGAQGKGNQGQADVAAAMDAKCAASGCDYVIGVGNNIYDSGAASTSDPGFATMFETPYADVDLPFWLGLGNHDYGGNGTGYDAPRAQVQVDYTAVSPSGNWRMPDQYYRRRDQHVEFFTLDTNAQMFGNDTQQESDVSSWLADSTARWKIALGLHSYRSNGPHGNAGTYDNSPFTPIVNGAGVRDFMEDHICGRADVHFSGFDHSLQWLQQDATNCPGTELIVSGAAASTSTLSSPPTYPTHYQSATLGFAYVVIEDGEMTVEFIDTEGTVLFTRTITK
jgi:tartrate-resistant acid phosphatase type 5